MGKKTKKKTKRKSANTSNNNNLLDNKDKTTTSTTTSIISLASQTDAATSEQFTCCHHNFEFVGALHCKCMQKHLTTTGLSLTALNKQYASLKKSASETEIKNVKVPNSIHVLDLLTHISEDKREKTSRCELDCTVCYRAVMDYCFNTIRENESLQAFEDIGVRDCFSIYIYIYVYQNYFIIVI